MLWTKSKIKSTASSCGLKIFNKMIYVMFNSEKTNHFTLCQSFKKYKKLIKINFNKRLA